jgi:hypothetical protein
MLPHTRAIHTRMYTISSSSSSSSSSYHQYRVNSIQGEEEVDDAPACFIRHICVFLVSLCVRCSGSVRVRSCKVYGVVRRVLARACVFLQTSCVLLDDRVDYDGAEAHHQSTSSSPPHINTSPHPGAPHAHARAHEHSANAQVRKNTNQMFTSFAYLHTRKQTRLTHTHSHTRTHTHTHRRIICRHKRAHTSHTRTQYIIIIIIANTSPSSISFESVSSKRCHHSRTHIAKMTLLQQ